MRAEEFVKALRKRVIDEDLLAYERILISKDIKDPAWKSISSLFMALDENQKLIFLNFCRLIKVNTLSHLFGILDGSSYLDESREKLRLISEKGDDAINGDLQDIFLEMEENEQ